MVILAGFVVMGVHHETVNPRDIWLIVTESSYTVVGSTGAFAMTSVFDAQGDSTVVYSVNLDIQNEVSVPLRIDSVAVSDSVSQMKISFEFHGIGQHNRWPRRGDWGGNVIDGRCSSLVVLSARRSQTQIHAGKDLAPFFGDTGLLSVRIYSNHGSVVHTIHEYVNLTNEETEATKLEKELMAR